MSKLIDRLRELQKAAEDGDHHDEHDLRVAAADALPALLARIEAAEAECEAWRHEHGCAIPYVIENEGEFNDKLTRAMKATDAAVAEAERRMG